MAWNCSLVTCFGISSPDGKATAFFAVGSGDGSTFPLFLSGDAVRNCCRADWLTLGELLTRHYYTNEGHEKKNRRFPYLVVKGDDMDPINGDVGMLERPA
jgi:hypothetical protein